MKKPGANPGLTKRSERSVALVLSSKYQASSIQYRGKVPRSIS